MQNVQGCLFFYLFLPLKIRVRIRSTISATPDMHRTKMIPLILSFVRGARAVKKHVKYERIFMITSDVMLLCTAKIL